MKESHIQLMKDNHSYRIGDIFQNAWVGLKTAEDYVLENCPDTILWKYLQVLRRKNYDPKQIGLGRENLKRMHREKRIHELLQKITISHGRLKNWEQPVETELVTHLRLGDIFQMDIGDGRVERTTTYLEKMWDLLPMDKFDRVTIVTAINFDSGNKRFAYQEKTENLSRQILRDHVKRVQGFGKVVRVKSSTPDSDFHYMITAKHFARGLRRLSTVASQVCTGVVYFCNKWGNFDLKARHQPKRWTND